jgi:serine protease AprX
MLSRFPARASHPRPRGASRSLGARFSRLVGVLLALVMFCAWFAPSAGASGAPRARPALLQAAGAQPEVAQRVIVLHAPGDASAERYARSKGYPKIEDVGAIGFVALIKGKDLADIASHPGVKYVTVDSPMVHTATVDTSNLATLYSQEVGAPSLYPAGTTGAGVGVAVIDTGVAGLPDFNDGSGQSRIIYQAKFSANTNDTDDYMGHGTHVAGIIAGNSWANAANPSAQGKYLGVAPGANLINLKVSDDAGVSYTSDVANAIEWAIANRQTYNIRVINLSMVASTQESYLTSALDAEVERAWFNGILVVVAAGNGGPNSELNPPANDPFVITVGAADPMNTVTPGDDTIAPWSGYGTTQDGFSKPDVVAPGRYVASTLASAGSYLATTFPSRIVDTNYIWMSGTSMAAPVVAGAAALAFQAHPAWTNDQVKWLLTNTATPLTSGGTPLPGSGSGEINAQAVVNYAGVPGLANQGQTINSFISGPNGATTYTYPTTSSWSTSSWSTSSWSTSSWSTSSWSTSSWSTSSWSTSSWSTSSWSTSSWSEYQNS